MKTIIQYIDEAISSKDKSILNMLNLFASNSSGVQHELFKQKIKDANSIDVVPLNEVFSKDEITWIKKYIHPKPKSCYENAYKLCDRFSFNKHNIKYCEGYMNLYGLPIDHAFNLVDGKYVDITQELALNNKIENTYVVIGEYNVDEVRQVLLQNEYYGDIYNTIFLNKYKENIKSK